MNTITRSTRQPTNLDRYLAYIAKATVARYNEAKLVARCEVVK